MGTRQNKKNNGKEPHGDIVRKKIAEAADVPKDVVLGMPLVSLTGKAELCIENYRGILEYTEELIRIRTKEGVLRVTGRRMRIEYYLDDEMQITGNIAKVEFENKEDGHC